MSSQTVEKKEHIFPIYETYLEDSINFDDIIIPFSDIGRSKTPSYIYKGDEDITFKKRHPIFQKLLLNEFTE
ncbi:MAG: hypothetical protein ACFE9Q_11315 [Candidatus Hodarchaeota archaeon]